MDGQNIVGVQFRRAGKLYDFSVGELDLKVGDSVVVDTDRGPSLAQVAQVKFLVPEQTEGRTLKPILRKASVKELKKESRLSTDYVTDFTKERVQTIGLKMRVLKSEVQFGGNKVIVYFTAPGRVDFRELVKELASGLKTRVELKQVGARDETKLLGGLGVCGREYCCSSFLREFVPVSIRMAKNQNLALNPSKVSGGCGRLLCCLTYEDEAYSELRKTIPPKGTRVKLLERGDYGDVIKGDLLNQVLQVETDDGQQIAVKVGEVEIVEKGTGVSADGGEWGEDINLDDLSDELMSAMEDDTSSSQIDTEIVESPGDQHRSSRPNPNRSNQPRRGSHDTPRSNRSNHQGQNRDQRPKPRHSGQQGQGQKRESTDSKKPK
jgi:cell fate regulator YaaT (PSP1 superfamily)